MQFLKLWAKVAEFVTSAMFGTNLATYHVGRK